MGKDQPRNKTRWGSRASQVLIRAVSQRDNGKGSVRVRVPSEGVSHRPLGRAGSGKRSDLLSHVALSCPTSPAAQGQPCVPISPLSPLLSAGLTSTGRCPRTSHSRRTPGPLVSNPILPLPLPLPTPSPVPTPRAELLGQGGMGRQEEGRDDGHLARPVAHGLEPCLPSPLSLTYKASGSAWFWKENQMSRIVTALGGDLGGHGSGRA